MNPEKQRDPIPQSPPQPVKESPQKQPQKNEPLKKIPSEIEQVEIDFPLDSPPEPRPRWRR